MEAPRPDRVGALLFRSASRFRAALKWAARSADLGRVPSLIAMVASSVVAWLLDAALRDVAGFGVSMLLTTLAGGAAFFYVKRFLSDLRGGS